MVRSAGPAPAIPKATDFKSVEYAFLHERTYQPQSDSKINAAETLKVTIWVNFTIYVDIVKRLSFLISPIHDRYVGN